MSRPRGRDRAGSRARREQEKRADAGAEAGVSKPLAFFTPPAREAGPVPRRRPRAPEARLEDLERIAVDVSRELLESLGLSGVCELQLILDIVRGVVAEIAQSGRDVEKEAVVKALLRRRDEIFKYVAAKLLEKQWEELTNEQLEFIVANAPEVAGAAAPQLYGVLSERRLQHLIESLRDLWRAYGKPLPVACPHCGFYSIAPDYSCVICGKSVSEEEVKRSLRFEELLRASTTTLPSRLLEEIVFAGYVLYDGEIKPPSMRSATGPVVYTITLSAREKAMLKEMLSSKKDQEQERLARR